jgi:hypothetical protein
MAFGFSRSQFIRFVRHADAHSVCPQPPDGELENTAAARAASAIRELIIEPE